MISVNSKLSYFLLMEPRLQNKELLGTLGSSQFPAKREALDFVCGLFSSYN
jgi:hypothetical protein